MVLTAALNPVRFDVPDRATGERLESDVSFREMDDGFYCSWSVRGSSGALIAAKSFSISRRVIRGNALQFCIGFVRESIERFQIDRQRVFSVAGTQFQDL